MTGGTDGAPELSVILPAFNEAGALPGAIAAYRESFVRQGIERWQLIVVDDGSRDETAAVLARLADGEPRILALVHPQNRGQVPALLTGFESAAGAVVTHNGIDLPFSPDDTAAALALLRDGHDVVVVERLDRTSYGLFRKVVSAGNSAAWRWLFRSPLSDHNFVQFYRRDALPQIWPVSRGVNTATAEMILRAVHGGRRVASMEAPYHRRQVGRSSVRLTTVLRAIGAVGGLWWEIRRRGWRPPSA